MKQIRLYSPFYEFGHIDKSWTSNRCPFDYQNLEVGDSFIHVDTLDGEIILCVCRVSKKEHIQIFGTLDIIVDVLEVKDEKMNKIY